MIDAPEQRRDPMRTVHRAESVRGDRGLDPDRRHVERARAAAAAVRARPLLPAHGDLEQRVLVGPCHESDARGNHRIVTVVDIDGDDHGAGAGVPVTIGLSRSPSLNCVACGSRSPHFLTAA